MSKQIELIATIGGEERKYTGRFLGFIKDDEFNALVQNTDKVATRLESKATQDLMEVAAKFDTMVGHRLVMSVKKIDDESCLKKLLYITEGLTIIDSVTPAVEKKWDNVKRDWSEPTLGKVTFQVGSDENIEVRETD